MRFLIVLLLLPITLFNQRKYYSNSLLKVEGQVVGGEKKGPGGITTLMVLLILLKIIKTGTCMVR